MNLIFEGDHPRLLAMFQSAFFAELIEAFRTNPSLTLREIKARVRDSKVDRKIDFLVKEQVIQRKDRRYSLAFPLEGQSEEKSVSYQEVKCQLLQELQLQSEEERMFTFLALYPEKKVSVPFILADGSTFSYREKMANDLLEVVSIATAANARTLPHYFDRQLSSDEREVYTEIEGILGDVDPSYYLDQVWEILEKIQNNRRRIRESIFVDSLLAFGIIKKSDSWSFNVPVYPFSDRKQPLAIKDEEFRQLSIPKQRGLIGELMAQLDCPCFTIIFMKE